ncbi:hypothetical protein SDC9_16640 [bioreactor metagenome]|uniref:Uncharacterized protein n=1 Tax=bioreactor metagenome TaxID=1076179 RepID=A0A644TV54_9ZZZZ
MIGGNGHGVRAFFVEGLRIGQKRLGTFKAIGRQFPRLGGNGREFQASGFFPFLVGSHWQALGEKFLPGGDGFFQLFLEREGFDTIESHLVHDSVVFRF